MAQSKNGYYITTYSVREELREPLRQTMEEMGLANVSNFLTMVAEHGDEVKQALTGIVAKHMDGKMLVQRGRGLIAVSVTNHEVLKGLTKRDLAALAEEVERIKAAKKAA